MEKVSHEFDQAKNKADDYSENRPLAIAVLDAILFVLRNLRARRGNVGVQPSRQHHPRRNLIGDRSHQFALVSGKPLADLFVMDHFRLLNTADPRVKRLHAVIDGIEFLFEVHEQFVVHGFPLSTLGQEPVRPQCVVVLF